MRLLPFLALIMSTQPAVALSLTVRNAAEDISEGNESSIVRASVVVACILYAFLLAFVQGKYSSYRVMNCCDRC